MTHYLELDLNSITLNPHLARQVPYALSRYYLALPIGRENGSVSVAMACPDNVKARRILSQLLQAQVVPLLAPASAIQQALDRVYGSEQSLNYSVLAWYGSPEGETAVFPPTPSPLSNMLHPNFFVRGGQQTIQRILVVMRGFASDEYVLDWLSPFAKGQKAAVTLMPLTDGPSLDLNPYLYPNSPHRQHLERCLRQLEREGVSVNLKFRQGDAVQQIVAETIQNTYDLLVMTAAAEGRFVNQVITAVDQHHAHMGRPIFVLKPPDLPQLQTNLCLPEGDPNK